MSASALTACNSTPRNSSSTPANSSSSESSKPSSEKITLKVFLNLADRKTGQELVEQKIIDDYRKENDNVTIEVEVLDEEAYKTKFKAYAMNGMPDVVSIWG